MRTLMVAGSTLAGVVIVSLAVTTVVRSQGAPTASKRPAMATDLERWKKELSNWGRWGKDDEIGALNLITPAKRKQAATLVKEGVSASLSSDAATQKDIDVPCPNEWAMITTSDTGATDRIAYPCIHGAGTTHLDAFG